MIQVKANRLNKPQNGIGNHLGLDGSDVSDHGFSRRKRAL